MDDLGVKVVFVTSESLYEHQRAVIESTFGAPVANGYGGRDAGFIAHQCPDGGMHITAEDIVVEIVGEDGEVLPTGERGEIVITHMRMGDFPFVRYRTGDVGSLSGDNCPCGRGLPLMGKIEGRSTDFIRAPDGRVIHGLALIYVLREISQIEEFKIIQESLNRITLQLVSGGSNRKVIEEDVTKQFRQRIGSSLVVNFEYVDKIGREASGKFRYVVSNVGD
jgi:phenylacetate-CoA ligase